MRKNKTNKQTQGFLAPGLHEETCKQKKKREKIKNRNKTSKLFFNYKQTDISQGYTTRNI